MLIIAWLSFIYVIIMFITVEQRQLILPGAILRFVKRGWGNKWERETLFLRIFFFSFE